MLNGTLLSLKLIGDALAAICGCAGSQCSVLRTQAHQKAIVNSCARGDAANDRKTRAAA